MIEARDVVKSFCSGGWRGKTQVHAVKGVSLSLEDGRTYAIVGESGSGKTTLSHLLLGLKKPDRGQVLLDGQPVLSFGEKQRFRKMQLVMQDSKSALDPSMTVAQSIAEPLLVMKLCSRKAAPDKVSELLQAVDLPADISRRRPSELSGGEQKRICIARALCVQPRFIFFDEATAGLDVIRREQVLSLIRALQEKHGFTAVYITHDLEVALYVADTIFVMKQGQVLEALKRPFLPESVQQPYTQLLVQEYLRPAVSVTAFKPAGS